VTSMGADGVLNEPPPLLPHDSFLGYILGVWNLRFRVWVRVRD
jgi:hypothetical protein